MLCSRDSCAGWYVLPSGSWVPAPAHDPRPLITVPKLAGNALLVRTASCFLPKSGVSPLYWSRALRNFCGDCWAPEWPLKFVSDGVGAVGLQDNYFVRTHVKKSPANHILHPSYCTKDKHRKMLRYLLARDLLPDFGRWVACVAMVVGSRGYGVCVGREFRRYSSLHNRLLRIDACWSLAVSIYTRQSRDQDQSGGDNLSGKYGEVEVTPSTKSPCVARLKPLVSCRLHDPQKCVYNDWLNVHNRAEASCCEIGDPMPEQCGH